MYGIFSNHISQYEEKVWVVHTSNIQEKQYIKTRFLFLNWVYLIVGTRKLYPMHH